MCRPNSPDQRIWRQSWTYQLVWSFAPSCWAWCCFWVDEGTSILAHWRIPAVSNTRRTVLGLSGWTPVPYWDSSTSVCQGFFWTFRITADFSLRVKPLLIPLQSGRPTMRHYPLNVFWSTASQLSGEYLVAERSPNCSSRIFSDQVWKLFLVVYIRGVSYLIVEFGCVKLTIQVFSSWRDFFQFILFGFWLSGHHMMLISVYYNFIRR